MLILFDRVHFHLNDEAPGNCESWRSPERSLPGGSAKK